MNRPGPSGRPCSGIPTLSSRPSVTRTTSKTTTINPDGSKTVKSKVVIEPSGPAGGRPGVCGGRPSMGGGRPSMGGGRPSMGGGRPSMGGGRPSMDGGRPSMGAPRLPPSMAGRPSTSSRQSIGPMGPTPGRPSGGRPSFGGPSRPPPPCGRPSTGFPPPGAGRPSLGAIPKRPVMKTVTSKQTIIDPVKGVKTTKKTVVQPASPPPQAVPPGQYYFPMQSKPHEKASRFQRFSSPVEMRGELDTRMRNPPMIFPDMKQFQNPRALKRTKAYEDTLSGSMRVYDRPSRQGSPFMEHPERTMMSERADRSMIEPYLSPGQPSPQGTLDNQLAQEVQNMSMQYPHRPISAKGSTKESVAMPMVMTPQGPARVMEQLTTGETIRRTPEHEIVSRRVEAIDHECCGRGTKTTLHTTDLDLSGGLPPNKGGVDDSPSREVMEITSTISLTNTGLRQTKETVVYETTKPKDNTDEVAALVQEENEDIEETLRVQVPELKSTSDADYALKKKLRSLQLTSDSVSVLEQSIVQHQPTADEDQEEIQPEVMAAIMHTEEQGFTMATKPTQMYNFLFPEQRTEDIINVSIVAPDPLQDWVVPLKVPSNTHVQAITHEMSKAAEDITREYPNPPPDDIYAEHVMKKEGPRLRNVAHVMKKKKRSANASLDKEQPPWDQDEGLAEIVGADLVDHNLSNLPDAALDTTKARIDYVLSLDYPTYMSRVQLRGTQKPSWFPGYVSAFPDIPDLIRIEKSASLVMTLAWKAVQPDHFPESSFIST